MVRLKAMSKSLKNQVWNMFEEDHMFEEDQVGDDWHGVWHKIYAQVEHEVWNMVVDRVSAQVYNQVRKVLNHE
jgi:hypothetical protein